MQTEPHDRHWIRLRGYWEYCTVSGDGRPEEQGRIKLPAAADAFPPNMRGSVRLSRRFQMPTNLDAQERVCITLSDASPDMSACLNGERLRALPQPLGDPSCWPADRCVSFDVTEQLRSRNTLTLTIEVDDSKQRRTGLEKPVLLEIVTPDDE